MAVEFDPEKDAINLAKHGVSLARAEDLRMFARVPDFRYAEPRMRAYGLIDGRPYCLAYVERGEIIRAISLRRCHYPEYKRYVAESSEAD